MRSINRVYLIGFMGCGKSTVGRSLSESLKWRFVDLDKFIEEKENKSISDIFLEHGEAYFRELEAKAIKEVSELNQVVIATGGGAPCYFDNIGIMKQNGLVIYLKLSPEGLCQRLSPAKHARPLIAGKTNEELLDFVKDKLSQREPYYCQAQVVADATAVGPEPYVNIIRMYEAGMS